MRRFLPVAGALALVAVFGVYFLTRHSAESELGGNVVLRTVDGQQIGTKRFLKGRSLISLFQLSDRKSLTLIEALKSIQRIRGRYGIKMLGVVPARGGIPNEEMEALFEGTRYLVEREGIEFPIVVDDGRLRVFLDRRFGRVLVPSAYALINGSLSKLHHLNLDSRITKPVDYLVARILRSLSITVPLRLDPWAGLSPKAPSLKLSTPAGGEIALTGKPVVLVFVSVKCPNCEEELELLAKLKQEYPEEELRIIAIVVDATESRALDFAEKRELDFLVLTDPSRQVREAFQYLGVVPDTILIDANGRIRFRHRGFTEYTERVLPMEIEALTGREVKMRLGDGYSGALSCRPCHSAEYFDWSLTAHSTAFDSLIKIGRFDDAECLGCHTVGWAQPGGYTQENLPQELRGVQCENCHTRNGPHDGVPAQKMTRADYIETCNLCHRDRYLVNFDPEQKLKEIDHTRWSKLENLGPEERVALLEKARKREDLFAQADYTGARSCSECHEEIYKTWRRGVHSKAFESVKGKPPKCTSCHSTHGTAGVTCEACHGPASAHIAFRNGKAQKETILSLSKKCPECVVSQVCLRCHDEQNDPEFELEERLPVVRSEHGFKPQN